MNYEKLRNRKLLTKARSFASEAYNCVEDGKVLVHSSFAFDDRGADN